MAAKITYDIVGQNNYLKEAEYSFEIFNFLNSFEDQFQLAEKVEIVFEDEFNPDPKKLSNPKPIVSEEGREIEVKYKTFRFSMGKAGLSKPDVQDFFTGLRNYFEKIIIKADNERFEALNNNEEGE